MNNLNETHSSGHSAGESGEAVSFLVVLALLVRERRIILRFMIVGIIISLVIGVQRRATYTTSFSFLPQWGQEARPSGLSSLAGQFGISIGGLGGGADLRQLYGDLLLTTEILGPIASDSFSTDEDTNRIPLSSILNSGGSDAAGTRANTIRALRRDVVSLEGTTKMTGMVTVNVRTPSASVSKEIAERLLNGLNHFNLVTRQSQAHEEMIFTKNRLEAAGAELRTAEDALQRFLQTNRQFAVSPALTFERDRLARGVALQQQVVVALAQQYEENRIREVRDTPVITVIDRPERAAYPDPRLRGIILLLGILVTLFFGVLTVMARETLERERSTNGGSGLEVFREEWNRIRWKKPW